MLPSRFLLFDFLFVAHERTKKKPERTKSIRGRNWSGRDYDILFRFHSIASHYEAFYLMAEYSLLISSSAIKFHRLLCEVLMLPGKDLLADLWISSFLLHVVRRVVDLSFYFRAEGWQKLRRLSQRVLILLPAIIPLTSLLISAQFIILYNNIVKVTTDDAKRANFTNL